MATHTLNLVDPIHSLETIDQDRGEVLSLYNFEDTLIVNDDFLRYRSFRANNLVFEEAMIPADVFVLGIKQRYSRDFVDGLSPLDSLLPNLNRRYSRDFGGESPESILRMGENIVLKSTIRSTLAMESLLSMSEGFSLRLFPVRAFDDSLSLGMDFITAQSERWSFVFDDKVYLTEKAEIPYSLIVVGGLGSGDYLSGTLVDIQASLDDDEYFLAWIGDVSGVTDISAKNTTILMFQIGGVRIEALKARIPEEEIQELGGKVTAAKSDIVMEQGTTFERNLYYRDNDRNPIDITGYTAAMHVRAQKNSTDALLTLTSSAGYIVIGGATGHLEIHIPANEMEGLNFVWGFYDLELYPEGDTTQAFRLLEGRIRLTKEVTR